MPFISAQSRKTRSYGLPVLYHKRMPIIHRLFVSAKAKQGSESGVEIHPGPCNDLPYLLLTMGNGFYVFEGGKNTPLETGNYKSNKTKTMPT